MLVNPVTVTGTFTVPGTWLDKVGAMVTGAALLLTCPSM